MGRVVGLFSLFAAVYYMTIFLSNRTLHGALLGSVVLGVAALLALSQWPSWVPRAGWFQGGRPGGWPGWALIVGAVALCALRFVVVDVHSHSASDTLIGSIPVWCLIVGAVCAVARATGTPETGA